MRPLSPRIFFYGSGVARIAVCHEPMLGGGLDGLQSGTERRIELGADDPGSARAPRGRSPMAERGNVLRRQEVGGVRVSCLHESGDGRVIIKLVLRVGHLVPASSIRSPMTVKT